MQTRLGTAAPELLHFPNLTQWLKVAGDDGNFDQDVEDDNEDYSDKMPSLMGMVMAMVTMMPIQVVGVSPETGEVIRSRVRNLEELKVVETMINIIIILIIIIMIMKKKKISESFVKF